jgi:superfamily II DNA or RNA helicase
MSDVIVEIVRHNKNRLKLKSNSKQILEFVRKRFTCKNPNFRHIPFGSAHVSCISPTYTFQGGLALDIISAIKSFNPAINIRFGAVKDEVIPFTYKVSEDELVQPENTKYTYRDYQADGIRKGLRTGRGTFEYATSAGKSLIIYGLLLNIWKQSGKKSRMLLLVPNVQLVEQMYGDIIDYGCDPSLICKFSSKYRECEDVPIIISNRSWLERHADELPSDVEILMVDECHQLSPNSKVGKFVSTFDTKKRFGFTGTLPNYEENLWYINGLLGKTLIKVKPHELQKTKHIADTKIISIRFEHPNKAPESDACREDGTPDNLQRAKDRYPLEWRYIEACQFTNNFMVKMLTSFKGNTILLYDHTEHGDILLEEAKALNLDKQIFFINGSTPVDYREMVRAKMEEDNNCFLIGNTKCISTGISIKNVHNIGFSFSSGKSSAKILQSIGRGLRLRGKFDKTHVKLIDFYSNFKYSTEHYSVRLKMYKENYELDKIIMKTVSVRKPLSHIFDF